MDEAEKSPTIDEESDKSTQQDKILFSSVKFFLAQCNNEDNIKNLLINNGATHFNYLTERVTHAISDFDCPEAEEAVDLFDKPVVNSSWIHMSLKANKLLPTVAFSPLKNIFHNIVVSFSPELSPSDVDILAASLTFYGAHVTKEESVSTHLIAASADDSSATSEKQQNLKIVGPDWILESIRNKQRLDELLFDPKLLLPPPPPTPEPEPEPPTRSEPEKDPNKPSQSPPRQDLINKIESNTKIDNNPSHPQSHIVQSQQKVYPSNNPNQAPRLRPPANIKVPQAKFRPSIPISNSPIVQRPPIQQPRLISQDPQQPKKVIISYGPYQKVSPNQANIEYLPQPQQQQQSQSMHQHQQMPMHHQPRQLTHVQQTMHPSPLIQHQSVNQPLNQQMHPNQSQPNMHNHPQAHQAVHHHGRIQHGPHQQMQPNQSIIQRQPMIQPHIQHQQPIQPQQLPPQQLQHQPIVNHQPGQQNHQILEQHLIHQQQPHQQPHTQQHTQHIHHHQQMQGHSPIPQHQPISQVQGSQPNHNQHIIQYHPQTHQPMQHNQHPHSQQQIHQSNQPRHNVPISQPIPTGAPNMMHHNRPPQQNMYNQVRGPPGQYHGIQRGPPPPAQNPQQMMNRFQEPSYQNAAQNQQMNIQRPTIYYNQNPSQHIQTRPEHYSPQKSSPTSYPNNNITTQPPSGYMQPANLPTTPIGQQQQKLPLQQQQQIISPPNQGRSNNRPMMPVNNQTMQLQPGVHHPPQQPIQPYPSIFEDTKILKVPVIDPPIKYYAHDSQIIVPENQPFYGCRFKMIDHNDSKFRTKVIKTIKAAGGCFEDDISKLTHLICEHRLSETYKYALKLGVRCVTVYWIDDILAKNKLCHPWKALHLPVLFHLSDRPLCNELIAITNISDSMRRYVREMIFKTGARYTTTFSPSNTLLICGDVGGQKYERAVEWRTPIANHQLLTDYLLDSRVNFRLLLLEPKYQIFRRENYLKINSYNAISDLMKPWEKPIKLIDEKIEVKYKGKGEVEDGEQEQAEPGQANPETPSTRAGEQNNIMTNGECKSPRISLNSNDSGIMTGGSNISESDVLATKKPPDQSTRVSAAANESTIVLKTTTSANNHATETPTISAQQPTLSDPALPPPQTTTNNHDKKLNIETSLIVSLPEDIQKESNEIRIEGETNAICELEYQDVITASPRVSTDPIRLMFTHLDSNLRTKLEAQAKKLGMEITVEPSNCTHLIVDRIVRTPTFICAFNYAKHILSYKWIVKSHKRGQVLDELPFIIKDKNGEDAYCFDLVMSLLKRDKRASLLFKDHVFFVTPSVLPSVSKVKEMIESAGGIVVTKKRPSYMQIKQMKMDGKQFVAVTCQGDLHLCVSLMQMGVDVVSVEFVFSNILRQDIEFEVHRLQGLRPAKKNLYYDNTNESNHNGIEIPTKRIKQQ